MTNEEKCPICGAAANENHTEFCGLAPFEPDKAIQNLNSLLKLGEILFGTKKEGGEDR